MIYKARKEEVQIIAELAIQMWEDNTVEDLKQEFAEILDGDRAVLYLHILVGQPAGFAQCQLRRDYVEGTDSSPVGYLEGIYIKPKYRKQGYAKELLRECEKWAVKQVRSVHECPYIESRRNEQF
uniref:GNAT family N-acetyltransferase n=1 Tax=Acetatifactor sp. TaxID=1872090 RepID=UPI004057518A